MNDDSKSHRSIPIDRCMILHPIYICCGQSARDNIIDIIIHTFKQRCRRCTLPRGLGLSPIRKLLHAHACILYVDDNGSNGDRHERTSTCRMVCMHHPPTSCYRYFELQGSLTAFSQGMIINWQPQTQNHPQHHHDCTVKQRIWSGIPNANYLHPYTYSYSFI